MDKTIIYHSNCTSMKPDLQSFCTSLALLGQAPVAGQLPMHRACLREGVRPLNVTLQCPALHAVTSRWGST